MPPFFINKNRKKTTDKLHGTLNNDQLKLTSDIEWLCVDVDGYKPPRTSFFNTLVFPDSCFMATIHKQSTCGASSPDSESV